MKETTILITDSGLGGLSVCAGMEKILKTDARYDKIHLIYFNAWPQQYKGYNHYPDRNAKAKVFHNAMTAMGAFHPDHIYIACNTLSVIYPFTRFAGETTTPVTGIVAYGVDMVKNALEKDSTGRAVIFGTPTTAQENSHKSALVAEGIDENRVIPQGCLDLAGKIERAPFSDEVRQKIDENAKAAADQLKDGDGTIYAALCCTHFGYCQDRFKAALEQHTGCKVKILNPNDEMVKKGCQGAETGGSPEIRMTILSRVTWEPSRIDAYEKLLSGISPATVTALKAYTLDRDLFSIDIE